MNDASVFLFDVAAEPQRRQVDAPCPTADDLAGAFAVYSGRDLRGYVLPWNGEWIVLDPADHPLGSFTDRKAAIAALSAPQARDRELPASGATATMFRVTAAGGRS